MKIEDIRFCAAASSAHVEKMRPQLKHYTNEGLDRLRRAFIIGYSLCMAHYDQGSAHDRQKLVSEELERQQRARRELEIQRDAIAQRLASVSGEIKSLEMMLEMGPQPTPADIRPGLPE